MFTRTAGVLLLIFIVLAVAWGLTHDPVDQQAAAVPRTAPPRADSTTLACTPAGAVSLPDQLRESSGLAVDPVGRIWSHNDSGGNATLFAVDRQGTLTGTLPLQGARNVDWEDLDVGPCGEDTCLFVADIGDNDAERASVTIYRTPVPDSGTERATAEAFQVRYPQGPRDAEGLFALPDGRLFVVSKGRNAPIQLFQVADPEQGGTRLVRDLGPEPDDEDDRVTAATATPDGAWVAIRTYAELRVYRAGDLVGGGPLRAPFTYDLRPLRQPQGEGLAIRDDGTVWLSSEAGDGSPPGLARLDCTLPAP